MARGQEPFDLVVVGAGIIGTMVALLARRRHLDWRIALLDRSLVGHGATLYSAFLDLPIGATPGKRALAERSRRLYQELRSQLRNLPLCDLPALFLSSEETSETLLATVAGGVDATLRPVDDVGGLSLAPAGFRAAKGSVALVGIQATRCTDNTLVPLLVRAFLSYQNGMCLEGVEVVKVVADGEFSQRVRTHDGRELSTRRTALCLGPWQSTALPSIAATPSSWRVKKLVALHVPLSPHPGAPVIYLADDDAFFLPQPEHGRFLFSFRSEHWDCQPEVSRLRIEAEDWLRASAILDRHLDGSSDLELGGQVFCDGYGAEGEPSVEPLAGIPGAVAVGGASGSGFRLAPAIAEQAILALEHP